MLSLNFKQDTNKKYLRHRLGFSHKRQEVYRNKFRVDSTEKSRKKKKMHIWCKLWKNIFSATLLAQRPNLIDQYCIHDENKGV